MYVYCYLFIYMFYCLFVYRFVYICLYLYSYLFNCGKIAQKRLENRAQIKSTANADAFNEEMEGVNNAYRIEFQCFM